MEYGESRFIIYYGGVSMPRHPRIHYPGAIYHVIVRGNSQSDIFIGDDDYRKYLFIIKDYLSVMPFYVLAYALMTNHAHFLIEVGKLPLGKFMKLVQQRYTQYFNLKHDTIGHVFQGRYKALIVKKEDYLLQLISYIHLNAKKAGLEYNLGDYLWTGHHEMVKKKNFILDVERLLSYFDNDKMTGAKMYFALMNQSESFEPDKESYFDKTEAAVRAAHTAYTADNLDILKLLDMVANLMGIESQLIISNSKKRDVSSARKVFIFAARHFLQISGNDLADYLKVSPEYVARVYQGTLLNKNTELNRVILSIKSMLLKGQ